MSRAEKKNFCPHWPESVKNGICRDCKMDLSEPRLEKAISKFTDPIEAMKFSMERNTQEYIDLSALRSEYKKLQARNQKLEDLLKMMFAQMSNMACCGYGDFIEKACEEMEGALKENGEDLR